MFCYENRGSDYEQPRGIYPVDASGEASDG